MQVNEIENEPEFLLCAYRAYGARMQMSELDLADDEQRERARMIYDAVVGHFYEHLHEEPHFRCVDAMLCLVELRRVYGKEFDDKLTLNDIKEAFEYFANQEMTSGLIRMYVLCKPLGKDAGYQQSLCQFYASGLAKVCENDDVVTPRTKLSLLRRALCMPDMPKRSLRVLTHLALVQMDAEDKLRGIYV
jgi:hypothetical protein